MLVLGLGLGLVLEAQVLGLGLGLAGQVLVNITGKTLTPEAFIIKINVTKGG